MCCCSNRCIILDILAYVTVTTLSKFVAVKVKTVILDRFGYSTLTVSKPHDGRQTTLTISKPDTYNRQQTPTIQIYEWQPNHRVLPRPSLSIEHREFQPHDSWNGQFHGSPSLQVEVSSQPDEFSASDSAFRSDTSPLDLEFSSTGRAHTSGYAQSFASLSDERARNSESSGYVSGDSFGEGHAKGTSASRYRGGSSVARVNAQAAGNGHAQGTASSEAGSFVSFPEGGSAPSQTIPLRHVSGKAVTKQEQYDGDIISDLAQAVGELLDVA